MCLGHSFSLFPLCLSPCWSSSVQGNWAIAQHFSIFPFSRHRRHRTIGTFLVQPNCSVACFSHCRQSPNHHHAPLVFSILSFERFLLYYFILQFFLLLPGASLFFILTSVVPFCLLNGWSPLVRCRMALTPNHGSLSLNIIRVSALSQSSEQGEFCAGNGLWTDCSGGANATGAGGKDNNLKTIIAKVGRMWKSEIMKIFY